jgi:hypothetical protein
MAPQPSVLVISILPGSSLRAASGQAVFGRSIANRGAFILMYCFDGLVRFQIGACVSTRLDRTLFADGVRITAPLVPESFRGRK